MRFQVIDLNVPDVTKVLYVPIKMNHIHPALKGKHSLHWIKGERLTAKGERLRQKAKGKRRKAKG
jgi:hypothetical protein